MRLAKLAGTPFFALPACAHVCITGHTVVDIGRGYWPQHHVQLFSFDERTNSLALYFPTKRKVSCLCLSTLSINREAVVLTD
jgi:hypothetical protein